MERESRGKKKGEKKRSGGLHGRLEPHRDRALVFADEEAGMWFRDIERFGALSVAVVTTVRCVVHVICIG